MLRFKREERNECNDPALQRAPIAKGIEPRKCKKNALASVHNHGHRPQESQRLRRIDSGIINSDKTGQRTEKSETERGKQ
jgi:hypothetical protein